MAPYVSAGEVLAELPNTVKPSEPVIESYVAEAERRATHRLGDPLPAGSDTLKAAIRDYAVAKALEKAYRSQSRELFQSARQLRQDALDLMDEVDAEESSPEENSPDKNIAYVRRVRL